MPGCSLPAIAAADCSIASSREGSPAPLVVAHPVKAATATISTVRTAGIHLFSIIFSLHQVVLNCNAQRALLYATRRGYV
ncbi:MAG: hypothetical protein LBL45_10110 [Treponema sp.]|nr:hypothetical protein [Treponema sp.]